MVARKRLVDSGASPLPMIYFRLADGESTHEVYPSPPRLLSGLVPCRSIEEEEGGGSRGSTIGPAISDQSLEVKKLAAEMWMVLRGYGAANLRKFLRGHVRMAKVFEGLVRLDRRFEVAVPRLFSTVCFRVRAGGDGEAGNELNRRVLESVNREGRVFMTHAVVGGVYVMRFAAGGTLTEERHVREAWVVVKEHVEKVAGRIKVMDGQ